MRISILLAALSLSACAASIGAVDPLKEPHAILDLSDPEDPESQALRMLTGQIGPDEDFELGLWDGYGAFLESNAAPGSYPISGDDADPVSCGICLYLTITTGEIERLYLATAGALDLESVDGELTGVATGLRLDEVDDMLDFVPGGCRATIASVRFDVPLESP